MGVLGVYTAFVLSCLAALVRPVYGVYGYALFVGLCPQWLWQYSLPDLSFPFQKYIAGATIAGFVLWGFPGQRLQGRARAAAWCGAAFLGLCWLSTRWSAKPEASAFFMDNIWKMFLMGFLTIRLIDTHRKAAILVGIVAVTIGWNALEINLDYLSRGYSLYNQPGNGYALMNANAYAMVLQIAAVLCIAVGAMWPAPWPALAASIIALLCVHAIYILESRGSMLGLITSCSVFVVFLRRTPAAIGRLALCGVCALALAGPSVVREFESSFAEKKDSSAQSRYYLWDAGTRLCLDHPWLGVGPWAGEWELTKYYQYQEDLELLAKLGQKNKALHNLLFEIATGCGIPATLCYLAMYFLPLRTLNEMLRNGQVPNEYRCVSLGVIAAVPGYWLASMFNSGALIEVPYLLAALAIAVSAQSFSVPGAERMAPETDPSGLLLES